MSLTSLGGAVQTENPQSIRFNKRISLLDFAIYSHSVQFESYKHKPDAERLQLMKDYSAKVSYANISGLFLKSTAGCILAPFSFDLEFKKTCLFYEGQTAFAYNINTKQFSTVTLQLSQTFIKQVESIVQTVSQSMAESLESFLVPKDIDTKVAGEDIQQFQELFSEIYTKFLSGKDNKHFTPEKLELGLEPEVSVKFFSFLETLSPAWIVECVKAAVQVNFEIEKNSNVPAFLQRMITNSSEEEELKKNTDELIVNEEPREELKEGEEVQLQDEWTVKIKNQSIEVKYYGDHEKPATLVTRIMFQSNEFALVGEGADYKMIFTSSCVVTTNRGEEIRSSQLAVSNIFPSNYEVDNDLGNIDFSLKPVEITCQISGNYCDFSLRISEVGLDLELFEETSALLSSKKIINEIESETSEQYSVDLTLHTEFSAESFLLPKSVTGTIGHIRIEDTLRLNVILQAKMNSKENFVVVQNLTGFFAKFANIDGILSIVDIESIFQLADVGLKFCVADSELYIQNRNFLVKGLSSQFLANYSKSEYREISTKFQFYFTISEGSDGSFKQFDFKISHLKIATNEIESALIVLLIKEGFSVPKAKSNQQKKIKGR
mgnify:FL=1